MGCLLSCLPFLAKDFDDDGERRIVYANTDRDYGTRLAGTGTWSVTYDQQPNGQAPRRRSILIYPEEIEGVPPGLETLISLNRIFVQKNHPFYRVMTNFQQKMTYTVQNNRTEYMLFAAQEPMKSTILPDWILCLFCNQDNSYVLHVSDNCEREVMRIRKRSKPSCCLNFCGKEDVCDVESPPGRKIGTITQRRSLCSFNFSIRDEGGRLLYEVTGPCFLKDFCFGGGRWSIRNGFGLEVASLERTWVTNGASRENSNEAVKISCPEGLEVKKKALFLGTSFFLVGFVTFWAVFILSSIFIIIMREFRIRSYPRKDEIKKKNE